MVRTLLLAMVAAVSGCGASGLVSDPPDAGFFRVSRISCEATNASPQVVLDYSADVFSDGSSFIACSVATSAGQFSHDDWVSAQGDSVVPGACRVIADVDSPSFGSWWFQRDPDRDNLPTATYSDPGSIFDNVKVEIASGQCVTE